MKKTITILTLLVTTILTAQNFQGKAIYKTSRKMDFKIGGERSTISEEQKAKMKAMMAKQFQKTFVLTFDNSESIYKEEKSLAAPKVVGSNGPNVMIQTFGGGGGNDVYYKNIKDNKYVNKTEIMGKLFLIKDELPKFDWKLTSETKTIGTYTCYKATFTRQEERTSMSMDNGKMTEKKEKVDVVTTAWYTPQIAVSNGPRGYTGLPGLILEIKEGNETIICSEIVLNPKEKITIEEPKKGKKVSQDQFDKILQKKTKEMVERFKSRRNSKGNNIEIRIGG